MNVEIPEAPDEDNAKSSWLRHDHTLKLRRVLRKNAHDAHVRLLSICAKSSDPEVRGQYEVFMSTRTHQILFESDSSKKDPDAYSGG